ncbi:MAG: hypothetical protein IPF66_15420 [Holophagales bacterium]|nr:hypothetical protein [Holophagales bacterium]
MTAVTRASGNMGAAARSLGIHRNTLRAKISLLRLKAPAQAPRPRVRDLGKPGPPGFPRPFCAERKLASLARNERDLGKPGPPGFRQERGGANRLPPLRPPRSRMSG